MNSNNHNPGIVPGYYNPQQSKTEALDYQAFLGEGFVDVTQIPMIPGDTRRPIQTQPVQDNRAMPSMEIASQNYQQQMQSMYAARKLETGVTHNKTVETIKIPIVIELTINLNINHASNI